MKRKLNSYLCEIILRQSSCIEGPLYWIVATILKLPFEGGMAILRSLLNHFQVLIDLGQIIQRMSIDFLKSEETGGLYLRFLKDRCTPPISSFFSNYTYLFDLSWSVSFSSSVMKCSLESSGGFPICKAQNNTYGKSAFGYGVKYKEDAI